MGEPTYGMITEDEQRPTAVANDPVLADDHPGIVSLNSVYDEVLENIQHDSAEEKDWEVPDRPSWRTRHTCYIDPEELKDMREKAREGNRAAVRSGAAGVDMYRLYRSVVRRTNTGVLLKIKGSFQLLADEKGQPITLDSEAFLEFVKRSDWGKSLTTNTEAIDRFLTPGWISALGDSIMAEAGHGRTAEPVNP